MEYLYTCDLKSLAMSLKKLKAIDTVLNNHVLSAKHASKRVEHTFIMQSLEK